MVLTIKSDQSGTGKHHYKLKATEIEEEDDDEFVSGERHLDIVSPPDTLLNTQAPEHFYSSFNSPLPSYRYFSFSSVHRHVLYRVFRI
jgi:hypothetical protein